MKRKCEVCGSADEVGLGYPITMVCPVCGSADLSLDNTVDMFPVNPDSSLGAKVVVKAKEPLLGKHGKGFMWILKERELKTVEPPPPDQPPTEPPKVKKTSKRL